MLYLSNASIQDYPAMFSFHSLKLQKNDQGCQNQKSRYDIGSTTFQPKKKKRKKEKKEKWTKEKKRKGKKKKGWKSNRF